MAVLIAFAAGPASAYGPKLTEPRQALLSALECSGSLTGSPRPPILLVHGTGVTHEENWSFGYRPVLADRGHSVCTVKLPGRAYGDVQRSLEYVVTAIGEVNRRSGRKVSIIGHSQGAVLPPIALRIWPELATQVDDFIGLAGFYEPTVEYDCRRGCVPAYWQLVQTQSLFWQAVIEHPLPEGPSYTAIGTRFDEIVKPQPRANQLPAGPDRRSVLTQDLCPGRGSTVGYHHVYMAADAVAFELATDALDQPGPANPSRVSRLTCFKQFYDGFDAAGFAQLVPNFLTIPPGRETPGEPPLRCLLDPECMDATWTVPVIGAASLAHAVIQRTAGARLKIEALDRGRLKVRVRTLRNHREAVAGIALETTLEPGRQAFPLTARTCRAEAGESRCRELRSGRYRLELLTSGARDSSWTRERVLDLRVGRR